MHFNKRNHGIATASRPAAESHRSGPSHGPVIRLRRPSRGDGAAGLGRTTVEVDDQDHIMLREAESADDRNRAGRTMRHRREHRTVCLERYHDRQGMEVRFGSVGGNLALDRSAAPSVLQAWRSAAEFDLTFARHMVAPTPKRCRNRKNLKPHREPIRLRRDGLAKGEVVDGPTAMTGTPLRRRLEPRGCTCIAGPTPQLARRGEPVRLRRPSEPCNHVHPLCGLARTPPIRPRNRQ